MISRNGPTNRGSTKPGANLKLTSKERLNKHKDPPGLGRPRGMHPMWNPHKSMRRFLLRCSSTTPWCWQISKRQHNPTEHRLRCWPEQSRSYQLKSPLSPQIYQRCHLRTLVSKDPDIVQTMQVPQPIMDIVRPIYVPQPITICPVTTISIQGVGKSSTPTGIVHLAGLRSRKPILPQRVPYCLMITKNWRH